MLGPCSEKIERKLGLGLEDVCSRIGLEMIGKWLGTVQRGWEHARRRWYELDTSWKYSILLRMAYIKRKLYSCQNKVGVCFNYFGDHCMSLLLLSMEHIVTILRTDREH